MNFFSELFSAFFSFPVSSSITRKKPGRTTY